ncbi:hypothetical protein QR680_000818 [Steinernema hermaphroditum]|uniref:Uncharacterized protein n=1 Tax=Steinernema hermaphroditum TaxID=289476 RepID=A0AA39GW07_9BILA|nr:hypothetical protein QR680_000818 [Steinernema hermaphroditum]
MLLPMYLSDRSDLPPTIDEHDGISTTADLGIESPPPYENGHFSASDLARRLLKVDKDTPFAGVPPSPPAEPVPSPAEPNTNMEVRLLPGEVVVDDFIVFDRRRVRVQGLSTIPEEDAMNVGVRMPRRRTQRFVIPH